MRKKKVTLKRRYSVELDGKELECFRTKASQKAYGRVLERMIYSEEYAQRLEKVRPSNRKDIVKLRNRMFDQIMMSNLTNVRNQQEK